MRKSASLALLVLLQLSVQSFRVKAFSTSQMARARRQRQMAWSFFDNDDNADSSTNDLIRARTCFRNFLSQRSIQSFMFLLISFRDPHTVNWLKETLHAENLEHYHGTGAFNLTVFPRWDTVLLEVLSKPKETFVVSSGSRRSRGGRGWRGRVGGWNQPASETHEDNPYIEEKEVTYEIDVDPVSLVSRIVSVREQIAKEFVKDFDTMLYANDQILASYFETQENYRQNEETERNQRKEEEDFDEEKCEYDSSLRIPYSDTRSGHRAFDRYNVMVLFSNSIAGTRDSSPLRKGNFDLMLLLSTQESIHRVLKSYAMSGDEREVSFAWLKDFYLERVNQYFDGHQQQHGRADDFLEELLLAPPMLKSLDDSRSQKERVGLVDPLRMAEDIIRVRGQVGQEWKSIAENIPNEHMDLRRMLLAHQMGEQDTAISVTVAAQTDAGFE